MAVLTAISCALLLVSLGLQCCVYSNSEAILMQDKANNGNHHGIQSFHWNRVVAKKEIIVMEVLERMCISIYPHTLTHTQTYMHMHMYTHIYTQFLSSESVKNQRYLRSKRVQILVLKKKNPSLIDYWFEVWGMISSALFFSFSQYYFGNLGYFVVPYNFRVICPSSMKNVMSILIWTALNL